MGGLDYVCFCLSPLTLRIRHSHPFEPAFDLQPVMNKSLSLFCFTCFYVWMGCFVLATLPAGPASAKVTPQSPVNPSLQLQQAVQRLNLWLVDSDDSQVWRSCLLLNLLDTHSALGERADLAILSRIEARFLQPNAGLSKPVFRDVRVALRAQIEQLSEMHLRGLGNQADLGFAVAFARGDYRPITIPMLQQQRQRVVYDLESMLRYYRTKMRSRKRANLFYDLKLDQTIEFLNGMEFELPPEISVGKLDSRISGVEKQLSAIEEEIDAIPEAPQPDDEPEEDVDQEEQGEADGQAGVIEPALEIHPNAFGPVPDGGAPSLDELKRKQKVVKKQLDVLEKQRAAISKQDKPRRVKRIREFNQLREFEANFAEVSKTQTDPYFIAVQTSLGQFVRSYLYGTDDNLQEKFLMRLQDLEDNLLKLQGPEAREASGKLGESVGWLEDANQVSPLVAAIRAKYSLPNFYVAVSEKLLGQLGSREFTQKTPVRQNFKGRLVRGDSCVDGRVNLKLRNDPNQVHLDIGLEGSISAETYVQQGKLRVCSNTAGGFSAERSLFANIGGLLSSEPKVNVGVDTSFGGTTSCLRLVNRIASKKFAESKVEAQQTTAADAKGRLGKQFSEQTEEAIVKGSAALARAQSVIRSNARLAPELFLRSTDSQVVLVGKKSSPSALAAQNLPAISSVQADVTVRIHESVLSNLFERTFSGKTFTNDELAKQMQGVLGGKSPAALATPSGEEGDEDAEDESFSITFSNVRPIQFEFENNSLGVAISGRRFSQGGKKINAGLKIGIRFKIKRIDGKLKLVRDGKAELDYLGTKNTKVVAFRSVLNGKLNPEEGGQQISIDLPDNLLPIDQVGALKDNDFVRRMTLVQCRSEDGWLYLGWNHTPEHFVVQHLVDLPAIWTETVVSTMNDVYLDSSSTFGVPNEGAFQVVPEASFHNPVVFGVVSPIVPAAQVLPVVIGQPFVDQPFVEQPFVDQPFVDQPFVEQPVLNAPVVFAESWEYTPLP